MKNRAKSARKGELAIVQTMNDVFWRNLPKRHVNDAEDDLKIVNVQGIGPEPWSDTDHLTTEERVKLLRIVTKILKIKRHYELFALMQGEVQDFIPHEIMISAWGDFSTWDLTLDVISAIPRVRTGQLEGCSIDNHCSINNLLKSLHARWASLGRQPLLIINDWAEYLTCPTSHCDPLGALQSMGSVLVHGIHDHRNGFDSLYLAFNSSSLMNGYEPERFYFLVDTLIGQIDGAFGKVAGLKFAHTAANDNPPKVFGSLSAREVQIMDFVSLGKTNLEIAAILGISAFTVKNHVQRILRKLGVTNRTQAAAKQSQWIQRVRRIDGIGDIVPDTN